jgi:hypothetical protein
MQCFSAIHKKMKCCLFRKAPLTDQRYRVYLFSWSEMNLLLSRCPLEHKKETWRIMRIFRGSEGTAPYICDIGLRWRLCSSTGSPSYPPTHLPTSLLHRRMHDVPLLVRTWWLRQISSPCKELNPGPSSRSQSLKSWLCFCTSFWRYCMYKISISIG